MMAEDDERPAQPTGAGGLIGDKAKLIVGEITAVIVYCRRAQMKVQGIDVDGERMTALWSSGVAIDPDETKSPVVEGVVQGPDLAPPIVQAIAMKLREQLTFDIAVDAVDQGPSCAQAREALQVPSAGEGRTKELRAAFRQLNGVNRVTVVIAGHRIDREARLAQQLVSLIILGAVVQPEDEITQMQDEIGVVQAQLVECLLGDRLVVPTRRERQAGSLPDPAAKPIARVPELVVGDDGKRKGISRSVPRHSHGIVLSIVDTGRHDVQAIQIPCQ
jgi:hypothetical protein